MKTIEELAEIYANHMNADFGWGHAWCDRTPEEQQRTISGIRAALDALFESVGEMPTWDKCRNAYINHPGGSDDSWNAVRTLMLAAFAKATAEKDKRIAEFEAKLDLCAHLKAAWEAGKRVRCIKKSHGDFSWCSKGDGSYFDWSYAPSDYEIEPDTPDKRAKEKEAYARGEKVEYRWKGEQKWRLCAYPAWLDACEYRIAPAEEWVSLSADDVPLLSEIDGLYGPAVIVRKDGDKLWIIGADGAGEYLSPKDLFKSNTNIRRPGQDWTPCRKLKTSTTPSPHV